MDRTNVLHICSAYAKQKLYNELVSHIEQRGGIDQFVYVPVRSEQEIDGNRNQNLTSTRYRFTKILHRHHRILFRRKVEIIFRDLASVIDAGDFSVTHAHFLYSDGAVALKLKQLYGLPYIATVRNTDLNYFMRFRPDLMPLCRDILSHASAIIFVAPTYRDKLLERLPDRERDSILNRSHVIPNGVADFWLENTPNRHAVCPSPVRLLYVGDFSRNKNVPSTIQAAGIVAGNRDIRLTLVGGGGNGAKIVSGLLKSECDSRIKAIGRIDDPEELIDVYRGHDIFVMPSFSETFGVAYIEALSQGLPVVHSHGQGVDGYFEKNTVSEATNPDDPADIGKAIQTLAARLPEIRSVCINQAKRFEWSHIAEIYAGLYEEARIQA